MRILIVGGNTGIGKAAKESLEKTGVEVIMRSRSSNPPYDISNEESSLDLGEEAIDGLIYCPGSITLRPFHRLKKADFQKDLEINYLGAIKAIQDALPNLKKSDSASIVLFSTVAVGQGMPFHTSIAGAKGAIEGLGRSLAAELAPSIRVNVIAPSITDTSMAERLLNSPEKKESSGNRHPLKRVGEPEDIGIMAAFLVGRESSWVTGQVLAVDGGMSSLKPL